MESFTLDGVCDAMVSGLNLHVQLLMKSKTVNNEMITTVESFTLDGVCDAMVIKWFKPACTSVDEI